MFPLILGHVATPGLPTELQSRLTRWQQEIEVASGYQLGHLIHVRGKLKVYRGMMEIVASYHLILQYLWKDSSTVSETFCILVLIYLRRK